LVEFYVIESMGSHNPSDNASATLYGYVESDGGLYEIWEKIRTDAPSIQGTATYPQYWSVRTSMRCGGTVNTGNHFRAWQDAGLKMGKGSSVVLAIEGQWGGGSADLTVGASPTTVVRETPTPTRRTAPPHYTTHITGRTTTWDFDTTTTAAKSEVFAPTSPNPPNYNPLTTGHAAPGSL
jgi:endo-1,4-beta-xylanase